MKLVQDEEKLSEEQQLGVYAKQILENPLYKEYFLKARAALYQRFEKKKDADEWDEVYRDLKALDRFEKNFSKALATGKMAEKELSILQKAKKAMTGR